MTEVKPDGYCAWHPDSGWANHIFPSKEYGLKSLIGYVDPTVPCDSEFKAEVLELRNEGWQIKPVYLSDHPPVPVELVIKQFYDAVCKRAEENMLKTGKLEGAHFAAMRQELDSILPAKGDKEE